MERTEALMGMRKQIAEGKTIVGAGAGVGLSAKCAEAAGVDLIIIYNSGRYRMAGQGSLAGLLPYGDANAVVLDMAREVLPTVRHTAVLAGVNGTDPFRQMPVFLRQVQDLGFTGVQNFPTVGLYDGKFRQNLEETGMGYGLEVEMINTAHKMGLLTTPYVFDAAQAQKMTEAGADVVVAHMGLTTSGSVGAQTALSLDESVDLITDIKEAAKSVREDVIVLCHGGPIAMPDDVHYVLSRVTGVDGFFGASSMERLPTETAITGAIRKFKEVGR